MIDRFVKGALRLRLRFHRWISGPAKPEGRKPENRTKDVAELLASRRYSKAEQFTQYEMRTASHQNAIDLLPGWSSSFPPELGLRAGTVPQFQDSRIETALHSYGSIKGKTILEVGPSEGMQTHVLNGHEPARIDAIETSIQCYLRCLVTREILNIGRAEFYLGDINNWLDGTETSYDLAIASDVLHHMHDPAAFLKRIAARSSAIFISTHFYDEVAMPLSDLRNVPFTGKIEIRDLNGLNLHYHERSYQFARTEASVFAGMRDLHYWMRKDDILLLLKHLGYVDIVELDVNLDHADGPCMSVLAKRSPQAVS